MAMTDERLQQIWDHFDANVYTDEEAENDIASLLDEVERLRKIISNMPDSIRHLLDGYEKGVIDALRRELTETATGAEAMKFEEAVHNTYPHATENKKKL